MKASSAAVIARAACAVVLAAGPSPAAGREPKRPAAQARDVATPAQDAASVAAAEARVADEIAHYLTLARPGPENRWLEPLVGSWRTEVVWEAPGRQAARLVGSSENRWILGGRFLSCETVVGEGPSRVESTTIYGFDSTQRRFFAFTLTNLAGHVLQASGSYDPTSAGFLLSGRERDQATGGLFTFRERLSVEGSDRHVLRVYYDVPGGPPFKAVEAAYTRREASVAPAAERR
jgi:hypothetical protein